MRSAIATGRTPQGTVGWVVFLFAAPYVAVPAFLVFGHRRYPGYVRARRALRAEIIALHGLVAPYKPARVADLAADGGRVRCFEALAGGPLAAGNAVSLLVDGEAAFAAVFAAIDGAQDYVLAQFYTIEDDAFGRAFAARLMAKARAGVRVHLLYDALGSRLPRRFLDDLADAGVAVRNFHAIRRSRGRLQVNFRNHRKIVVVDGRIGFTGGMNVGEAYIGRDPVLTPWRDTMVCLEGSAVQQLQFIFAEDWLWSSGETPALDWSSRPAGSAAALVLAPGPADYQETGSLYFVNAIGVAQRRIWIASAYFVPDIDVLAALKVAALRGVDVRLLVPEARDHWAVWLAAFAYFDEVRAAGVKVCRYDVGFMHQKVLLIDDDIASVGSVNLDNRSCRLNFEVTLIVSDAAFAAEVSRMLTEDFSRAPPYTTSLARQPRWLVRIGAPLARLMAPML
ncbi:MAG: cardiolipin synthase [Rhodobacteraceae bacterium]|nr:cardiolipin synthase [Paracoccaceae bacterium]